MPVDPKEILERLMSQRYPVYAEADVVVDSTAQPADITTDQVLEALRRHLEPQPEGGTLVRTWAEFTGLMPLIAGRTIKEVLTEFTRTWYTRYAETCNRTAAKVHVFKKQPETLRIERPRQDSA